MCMYTHICIYNIYMYIIDLHTCIYIFILYLYILYAYIYMIYMKHIYLCLFMCVKVHRHPHMCRGQGTVRWVTATLLLWDSHSLSQLHRLASKLQGPSISLCLPCAGLEAHAACCTWLFFFKHVFLEIQLKFSVFYSAWLMKLSFQPVFSNSWW